MVLGVYVREYLRMSTQTEELPLAVDIREAARLLGVSPRTIQNYVSAKLLPARKLGRRTVIFRRSLESFLRKDQPSPAPKPKGNRYAR
jgi:excisionase family DNA binding protein